MNAATIHDPEVGHEESPASPLPNDPRWELANRIASSDPFQKSTRLPKLLLYLARHTITGERQKLTEQAIGQAVFGKRHHFDPAEDSSVRVNVRQLRLKLHEYYQSEGAHEELVVTVPKGGYSLDFARAGQHVLDPSFPATVHSPPEELAAQPSQLNRWLAAAAILLLIATSVCAIGWYRSVAVQRVPIPWPLNAVIHKDASTTLVIADAGLALRMLGNQEVPLDSYIARNYLAPLLPKHMTDGESSVLHYFDESRITSEADVQAAAVLSSLATPYAENLTIRAARDINANDLTHGDFIFIGSKTSNPWVELLDARMNFQLVENGPHGARYIANRNPQGDEKPVYKSDSMGTLASGTDYAIIALLPAKTGGGSNLLLEGVRMEGTKAAISLLQTASGRAKLQQKLSAMNGGQTPKYFEALLSAQSVAGATISVDVVSARVVN